MNRQSPWFTTVAQSKHRLPVDQRLEVSYFFHAPVDIIADVLQDHGRHQLALSEFNELDGPGSSDGAVIAKLAILWITISDRPNDSRWSTPSFNIGLRPKRPIFFYCLQTVSPKLYTSDNDNFGVFTGVMFFLRMQYDTCPPAPCSTNAIKLLYTISGKNSPWLSWRHHSKP